MAEALFERFPEHRVEVLGGEVSVEPLRTGGMPGQSFTLPGTSVALNVDELFS
ncbi:MULTISPECIES: hypothetical protein [unclassified Kitasatospora]|uniref:hypothetical protein n=1 Tax=unclassified Kitasatospora TaxID=2633591 RepID=UPI0033D69F72